MDTEETFSSSEPTSIQENTPKLVQNPVLRFLLIVVGTLCLFLAILGVFLPILPTTPFLLLAAACYVRSSESFYHWLVGNRFLGDYILQYRRGDGIPKKSLVRAILLLWATIALSLFFTESLAPKIILPVIALGVSFFLLSLPRQKEENI